MTGGARPTDTELLELQASEIRRQAEHIRELIRERDAAKSETEAAYDLAEQYATAAGKQVKRDDALRYVEQYWDMRGGFERRMTELETFHWDVFGIVTELSNSLQRGFADSASAAELASRIINRIRAISPSGGGRKPGEKLFPRPAVPDVVDEELSLFEEAS